MNTICNALRETPAGTHDEICTVLAGVAAWLKKPGALSAACTVVAVDMVDEAFGQVEQDKIDQQKEIAWLDEWSRTNQRAWNLCQDMPGFAGTYANLGALNLQQVAV